MLSWCSRLVQEGIRIFPIWKLIRWLATAMHDLSVPFLVALFNCTIGQVSREFWLVNIEYFICGTRCTLPLAPALIFFIGPIWRKKDMMILIVPSIILLFWFLLFKIVPFIIYERIKRPLIVGLCYITRFHVFSLLCLIALIIVLDWGMGYAFLWVVCYFILVLVVFFRLRLLFRVIVL